MRHSSYLLLFISLLLPTLTLPAKRKRTTFLDHSHRHIRKACLWRINALTEAIKYHDVQSVKNIITAHPPHLRSTLINSQDSIKRVPLELACKQGSRLSVSLLLEYGASTKTVNQQKLTPLRIAIYRGAPKIVQLLLQHGSNPESPERIPSPLGLTATLLSINTTCYYTIAKLLLLHGADPNQRDHSLLSPYMKAAMRGDKKLINLMNLHGADPLKPSGQGKSALEYASLFGWKKMAFEMERSVSKNKKNQVTNLLKRQPDDLLTGESLFSHALSSLIILNDRLWTKNSLMKHVLYKIGTNNGPRDPFTNMPIPKEILVRLAAYTRIAFQEIDYTQQNPNHQSLLGIARSLTPLEGSLSIRPSVILQENATLLKRKFNRRLKRFNPKLAESVHAS